MATDAARVVDFATYRARRDARTGQGAASAAAHEPALSDATRRVRAFNMLEVEHRRRMLRHLGGTSVTRDN
jgi:hypothetical protein